MSLYRPKKSPYWHYDFQLRGHRFYGSTEATTKGAARDIEAARKDEARERIARQHRPGAALTLNAAIDRYWTEWGQHQANAADLWRDFRRIIERLGADVLMTDITDDDVVKLVAWRRGHHAHDDPQRPLISPAQVNRTTTEMLRRVFVRARKKWKLRLDNEPDWSEHLLAEPRERVRELRADEDAALAASLDPDYEAVRKFSLVSGLRMAENLLAWSQVDFAAGTITTVGKGGEPIRLPMTSAMREILMGRRGHHPGMVFTYRAQRTAGKRRKGRRYPITREGLKTHWRRRRRAAGVKDYRWHDNRHTFATGLLRATGNLKLVQRGLNHRKIETTAKYAHVLDDELRAGMEAAEAAKSQSKVPKNIPNRHGQKR